MATGVTTTTTTTTASTTANRTAITGNGTVDVIYDNQYGYEFFYNVEKNYLWESYGHEFAIEVIDPEGNDLCDYYEYGFIYFSEMWEFETGDYYFTYYD